MNKINEYFKEWSGFEKTWLLTFTIIIIGLSLYWKDGIIGIAASLTGIWCVVLVAKNRISNYYVGIVNVIAYAYVAYQWQYYGEVMLNIGYFLPMQFVGLFLWKKNMENKKEVKVKFMDNSQRALLAIGSFVAIIIYALVLRLLGGNLPLFDSASTVLSVIAMILMAFAFMEQWILWIVVNIVSIILWVVALSQGGTDIAVLLMWCAYLVNSVYGLVNWIRMYHHQQEEERMKNYV